MYKIIFKFEIYGKISPRTNHAPLKKDTLRWPKLPKTVPPTDGNPQPVGWSMPRRWRA